MWIGSITLWLRNANSSPLMWAMFSSEPVSRLSTQITRCPCVEQVIAEMRAEESGSAGDDGSRHCPRSYSGNRIVRLFLTNLFHPGSAGTGRSTRFPTVSRPRSPRRSVDDAPERRCAGQSAIAAVVALAAMLAVAAARAATVTVNATVTAGDDALRGGQRLTVVQPDAERGRPDDLLHPADPGRRCTRAGGRRRLERDRDVDAVQRRGGAHVPDRLRRRSPG